MFQWLHGSGQDLCVDMEYDDSLAKPVSLALCQCVQTALTRQCNQLADKWNKSRDQKAGEGFSSQDVADFSSTQKGACP